MDTPINNKNLWDEGEAQPHNSLEEAALEHPWRIPPPIPQLQVQLQASPSLQRWDLDHPAAWANAIIADMRDIGRESED